MLIDAKIQKMQDANKNKDFNKEFLKEASDEALDNIICQEIEEWNDCQIRMEVCGKDDLDYVMSLINNVA